MPAPFRSGSLAACSGFPPAAIRLTPPAEEPKSQLQPMSATEYLADPCSAPGLIWQPGYAPSLERRWPPGQPRHSIRAPAATVFRRPRSTVHVDCRLLPTCRSRSLPRPCQTGSGWPTSRMSQPVRAVSTWLLCWIWRPGKWWAGRDVRSQAHRTGACGSQYAAETYAGQLAAMTMPRRGRSSIP